MREEEEEEEEERKERKKGEEIQGEERELKQTWQGWENLKNSCEVGDHGGRSGTKIFLVKRKLNDILRIKVPLPPFLPHHYMHLKIQVVFCITKACCKEGFILEI